MSIGSKEIYYYAGRNWGGEMPAGTISGHARLGGGPRAVLDGLGDMMSLDHVTVIEISDGA